MKHTLFLISLLWAISGTLLAAPVEGEWTGTLSCGELQNSPREKNKAPFTSAATFQIHKNIATLDRSWVAGKEHLEGTVSPGQAIKLEGRGWLYGKETNPWKVRVRLFEIGLRYEGEGVIESIDGQSIETARSGLSQQLLPPRNQCHQTERWHQKAPNPRPNRTQAFRSRMSNRNRH